MVVPDLSSLSIMRDLFIPLASIMSPNVSKTTTGFDFSDMNCEMRTISDPRPWISMDPDLPLDVRGTTSMLT